MKTVYSVSQINLYIKNMFRQDYMLQQVLVRGEVSNCKYHSSGHIYFTLKDEGGAIACVMFAGYVNKGGIRFRMREGDEIIVYGAVDVYERSGQYQLYAKQIIRDGAGALNERYEQLKKKLEEQGMFDESYKQPVPQYIHTLGVVTAPTGAAVRDIINIATRRNPHIRIILYPALVQGEGAKDSIVNGIRALDSLPPEDHPDTIIIGRGGGSLEDLWAFNEEVVAQAVFDCTTPIISAVGHETDTVITDYVADLRAPTPSAAAELAVYDYTRFKADLSAREQELTGEMLYRIRQLRLSLEADRRVLAQLSPSGRIREQRMFLMNGEDRLTALMNIALERAKGQAQRYSEAVLTETVMRKLTDRKHRLQVYSAGLDGMSPLKKLTGGFAYITCGDRVVESADSVAEGDLLDMRFADGTVHARVEE